jgi:hypothetical protein
MHRKKVTFRSGSSDHFGLIQCCDKSFHHHPVQHSGHLLSRTSTVTGKVLLKKKQQKLKMVKRLK